MTTTTGSPNPPRTVPWRLLGWGGAAVLLSLPALLDLPWTSNDFVLMGVLFAAVGLCIELAFRLSAHFAYRAGAFIAVLTAFLLVWINLAVGIIGNENNPLNLLYLCVIAVGFFGSVMAGFRAAGTAVALFAAAVAQAGVGVVALVTAGEQAPGAVGLVVIHLVFVMLITGAGALFRLAAQDQPSKGQD